MKAPVYQVPGTEVYLVSSWELIHQVLKNQEDYSANLTGILMTGANGQPELFDFTQFGGTVDAIANADEPFHSVHRKLVLPQLNSRKVAILEAEVREWARSGVRKLVNAGRGDCVGALANAIPVKVMARLVGLPVEDVDQLLSWAFQRRRYSCRDAYYGTDARVEHFYRGDERVSEAALRRRLATAVSGKLEGCDGRVGEGCQGRVDL